MKQASGIARNGLGENKGRREAKGLFLWENKGWEAAIYTP